MTRFRRWLLLGLILLGSQFSAGCYLGYTNRPILFPSVALSPSYVRPGGAAGCGPSCYREFGPSGCGGSLLGGPVGYGYAGAPVVAGPVYDGPVINTMPVGGYDLPVYGSYSAPIYGGGYSAPAPTPGCVGCGANAAHSGIPFAGTTGGIPIAGTTGGPPIAVSPPAGGPIHGVPYDSGAVPTLKPPPGSIPLQMPNEVKESKKIIAAGK
jgi:hypothetical protein